MKSAILFSGGKDSCLALHYALKESEVVCLISIISENKESYMFHTPNINLAEKQAEAIGIPIEIYTTKGEKELELEDLENAIKHAKEKYKIDAIYTGALASVYQASRIQKICDNLNLKCMNPLWQKDQLDELNELIKLNFDIIIIGAFAEGFDNVVGKKIDSTFVKEMSRLKDKYKTNPAGEGGEFESFVLNAPFFKKKLVIDVSKIIKDKEGGKILIIEKISLHEK